MNERDPNREESLDRLFKATGASIPTLEPDPGLPLRVRELAAAEPPRRERTGSSWMRPRWTWVPLAGAAFALSLIAGGYIGYRAWSATQDLAIEQREADVFMTAWSQSGLAEDLSGLDTRDNEVRE